MKTLWAHLYACVLGVGWCLRFLALYALVTTVVVLVAFYVAPQQVEAWALWTVNEWPIVLLFFGLKVLCFLLLPKAWKSRSLQIADWLSRRALRLYLYSLVLVIAGAVLIGICAFVAPKIIEQAMLPMSRFLSDRIDAFDQRTHWLSQKFGIAPVDMALLRSYQFVQSSHVVDADGNELGCFAKEYRIIIPLDETLKHSNIVQAILASEDHSFYAHKGFDLYGIIRAAKANFAGGRIQSGASTLDQQLMKNLYLSPEKTLKRKISEVIYSARLEHVLTKDEILYLYINYIYFGGGYGIEAASKTYFGKHAVQLSVAEAAFIAGLINQPNVFNTRGDKGALVAMERQKRVLRLMMEEGIIPERVYQQSLVEEIHPARFTRACTTTEPFTRAEVNRELGIKQKQKIAEVGLRIETTINMRFQRTLEEACKATLAQYVKRRPGNKNTIQCSSIVVEIATGEVLAMVGGQSFDKSQYNGVTQSDRQAGSSFKPFLYAAYLEKLYADEVARRNSACEMLSTAECAVLQAQPIDLLAGCKVIDSPVSVPAIIGWKGRLIARHSIKNYPYEARPSHRGRISCALAIAESRNAATIWAEGQLVSQEELALIEPEASRHEVLRWNLGSSRVIDLAYRLGIESKLQHENRNNKYAVTEEEKAKPLPNYTIPIGSAEVNLWEMARAFLAFVNGGCREDITFIKRALDSAGRVRYEHTPFSESVCDRVLAPEVALAMRTLLAGVVDDPLGTAYALRRLGWNPFAEVEWISKETLPKKGEAWFPTGALCGKTGTSTNPDGTSSTDNWFIGCTSKYLVATRVNNIQKTPLGKKETGGKNALPVFAKFIRDLNLLDPNEEFTPPVAVPARSLQTEHVFDPDGLEERLSSAPSLPHEGEEGAAPVESDEVPSADEAPSVPEANGVPKE